VKRPRKNREKSVLDINILQKVWELPLRKGQEPEVKVKLSKNLRNPCPSHTYLIN